MEFSVGKINFILIISQIITIQINANKIPSILINITQQFTLLQHLQLKTLNSLQLITTYCLCII